MSDRLIEILREVNHPRVLVVGDLILDKYVWGEVSRTSQEAPVPILNVTQEEFRAGGAGSVVANLARLGCEVLCCGVVGDDVQGKQLKDVLSGLGANVQGIAREANRSTIVKVRMMGQVQSARRGV